MARGSAFSTRAVVILMVVGTVAFVGAGLLVAFGVGDTSRTSGTNAYSYSAIGHRGIVEALRRLDFRVLVSRNNSDRKAGPNDVLVIAEPPSRADEELLETLLDAPATILFVLPKWHGPADRRKPRWKEAVRLINVPGVERTLGAVLDDAKVIRTTAVVDWKTSRSSQFDVTPTLHPAQLIRADGLVPVVAAEQGILVGRVDDDERDILVLSDPDVLANHGLAQGDNGVFAVRLIDYAMFDEGAVIIDETIHGFGRAPNIWRSMLEFPFVIATIQMVATIIILLWASAGRFGNPLPTARPIEPGKSALIANTASLLCHGGHGPELLRRYQRAIVHDVARRLHLPTDIGEAAVVKRLDRLAAARGRQMRIANLSRDADLLEQSATAADGRLVRQARRLHRWKQEMIHGSGGDTIDQ